MSRTWPRSPPGTSRRAADRLRNPVLAADRARKREDLLAATEKLLTPVMARVQAWPAGAGRIGIEAGKVIARYKTAKHFQVTITDDNLTVTRKQDQIDAEAALDGFYVLRTPIPASELDGPAVVAAYKNLKYVERDFRHIKSDDLDLRPVFHRLEERVRLDVLICMLACYLTWHLRQRPAVMAVEHVRVERDESLPWSDGNRGVQLDLVVGGHAGRNVLDRDRLSLEPQDRVPWRRAVPHRGDGDPVGVARPPPESAAGRGDVVFVDGILSRASHPRARASRGAGSGCGRTG